MKLPLYQVDVFTSRLFGGNPAAVVLLDNWLPDEILAAIAAENNLAETAFVIPRVKKAQLRWFTPAVEVDLCGHATMAAAHVLFRYSFPSAGRLDFDTRSGVLTVTRDDGRLSMDFPARPGRSVEVSESLTSALGRRPREAYLARDLMAIFDSEREIRALSPDLQKVGSIDAFAVMVTAPGDNTDFVFRFFAPRAGIPEDPATGSSHCTLVPYWAHRLGKTKLLARQLSPRGGEFACEHRGARVLITGRTVEYLRGELEIAA